MPSIILMEDDALQSALLEEGLISSGHTVSAHQNAESAWAALQENQYDLLVTDIYVRSNKTPIDTKKTGGGISLIGKVRYTRHTAPDKWMETLPIIAISGGGNTLGEHDPFLLVEKMGANLCLRKPFSLEELETAINMLINPPEPD